MMKQLDGIDTALYAIRVGVLIDDFHGVQLGINKVLSFLYSLQTKVDLRESLTKYKRKDKDYEKAGQEAADLLEN